MSLIRITSYNVCYTKLLRIDVNIDTNEMLEKSWELFRSHFSKAEVGIKQEFVDQYWERVDNKEQ